MWSTGKREGEINWGNLDTYIGELGISEEQQRQLITRNDADYSFNRIADWIEEYL